MPDPERVDAQRLTPAEQAKLEQLPARTIKAVPVPRTPAEAKQVYWRGVWIGAAVAAGAAVATGAAVVAVRIFGGRRRRSTRRSAG